MALDNFRTIELIWDKANKSIIKTIKTASSDTTGRYLSVKILDGGQEVTLNNAKLQLYWEHPNFNTSGTDDFNTVNNGGLFKMTFSEEMLTNIGELNAHLVLTLSDGNITSDGFPIQVFKGADDGVVVPTNGNGLVKQIDGKIDKGNVTLDDLTQEVKLAITGGALAVVGEKSVGTPQLVDYAVTPEKTTFLNNVHNMILNGSFSNGTVNWEFTSNSTQTVTDGKLRVTRISTILSSIRAFQPLLFEEGNEYLVHIGEFKQSAISVENPKINTRNASGQNITVASLENTTDIQSMSTIYTAKENTNYFDMYVYANGVGDYFDLDNVTVWNLTETFGLGKEPNLDDAKIMLETIFDGHIENSDYISQEGILNYFNQKLIGASNEEQTSFVREGEDISVAGIPRKIIRTDGKNLEDYAFSFDFKPNISSANLTSDIDYVLFAYENVSSYLRINYMRPFSRFNITSVKDGVTTTLQCRPMQFDKDDTIHIYLKPEQNVGIFVGFYKDDETKVEHLLTANTFPNNFKQITFGFRMREVTQIDGNGNTQTEYRNVKMTENAPNVVSHLNEVIK